MEEVTIPPGFPVGRLIGKAGANCKELQRRFGARVLVHNDRMLVQCVGGRFSEAAQAVRDQISAAGSRLAAYPHPEQVVYVLPESPAGYAFQDFYGPAEPVVVQGRTLPLKALAPVRPRAAAAGSSTWQAQAGTGHPHAKVRCQPGQSETAWMVQPGAGVYERMCDAVSKAKSVVPAFDEIKMRYAVGKQLFYESRDSSSREALQRCYELPDLNACVIGHEGTFKSLFSGDNEAATVARTVAAVERLGFKPKQEKLHVSVHLHDFGRGGGGVSVSLRVENGVCLVRKVKSPTAKPIFVSYTNADPGGPDFRIKIMAQHHVHAGSSGDADAAWGYASACTWSPQQQRVLLPQSERFKVDKTRIKTKQTYEGTYSGHVMQFNTMTVADGQTGELVRTLGGSVPGIQSALQPSAGQELPEDAVRAMASFCMELVKMQ